VNIACPECATVYRIDAAKVPPAGARSRCRECETRFVIQPDPEAGAPGRVVTAERLPEPEPAMEPTVEGGAERLTGSPAPAAAAGAAGAAPPVFGPQDPDVRARRLARALVSDIKVYHRERWEQSRLAGTLRNEFREEIVKSWDEYVEQVGEVMAKRTPFFRDALNDILAEGKRVF
jgi:predicted Zn finger-like uncharacterized protein